MLRRVEFVLARYRVLLWVLGVAVLAGIAIRNEVIIDRSDDRDAARAYQRCEQFVPPTTVLSSALDFYPDLAAAIQRKHPGLLTKDSRGQFHLEVPDCKRIYPRGYEASPRFPDLTPTRPAP